MDKLKEDGMGAGAPASNTGSTSSSAGLSSSATGAIKGYDPIMGRKRRKKEMEEENIDSTTQKSRNRFKKNAIAKPDETLIGDNALERFSENKTLNQFKEDCRFVIKRGHLNEDVYDSLYKIAGQKRPGYICLADRGVIQVDPIMASFLVNTISSLDLEKQKLFREMMNRNVLAFMYVLKTLKR